MQSYIDKFDTAVVATLPLGEIAFQDLRQPLMQLHQVVKVYKTSAGEFPALKGITFDIYDGEFVGIIGKSGAGKSTLLNIVTGVDHLTSGEVIAAGVYGSAPLSIHTLNESALAQWRGRNMGIVYQSFQLLPMLTLVENIMLPMDLAGRYRSRQSRERALELLTLVEMEDQAHKFPTQISGGQQQRAAIARALANDPPILVADEPTGSLDSVTAETIIQVFETLVAAGKTVIMATHDHSLEARFSRRLQISDGILTREDRLNSGAGRWPLSI